MRDRTKKPRKAKTKEQFEKDVVRETKTAGELYDERNWWMAHRYGKHPHEYLFEFVKALRDRQSVRYNNFRRLTNIYEWGFEAGNGLMTDSSNRFMDMGDVSIDQGVLHFNAAANVVDTVHAKTFKTKIIPMPLTEAGDWMQRENAKNLQKAIEGEFSENHFDEVEDDAGYEMLIEGTGWGHVFSEHGKIKIESVPAPDIVIDDAEGRYRKPRCIYHTKILDRFVVKAMFGDDGDDLYGTPDERLEAIKDAPSADPATKYGRAQDLIEVVEAIHLPSRPLEADEDGEYPDHDGRYSIVIDGGTMMDRPWNRNTFPFVPLVAIRRRRSTWGLSLMHRLSSGQAEFEKITAKVQLAFQKMAGSHFLTTRGAELDAADIDNDVGTVFEVNTSVNDVKVLNPESVSEQTLRYLTSIPQNMMMFTGVSSLSTQQQIPAGLTSASGKALQVYEDFESERLLAYHRGRERFILGIAQCIIEEAKEIVSNNADYSVRFRDKHQLEKVKWAEVLKDQESAVLTIFPVGMLSRTPSAKFEQLQELLNAGAITVEQFKRLFGMPDLEAENDLDTAETEIIDKMCWQIIYQGKHIEPQPFNKLLPALDRTQKYYNLCLTKEGIPEAHMEELRNFIYEIQDLIKLANPPPPPQPALPPMPMGPPGMVPPEGIIPPPMPMGGPMPIV